MTTVVSYSQDKIELILYSSCNFQIVLYTYHENSETRKNQQSGITKTIAKKLSSNVVTLRNRPTSEIRGPQTVGVIGQHNTAHEIPKIDVFISEQQITGI